MNSIDQTMQFLSYERRMRHVQRLAGTIILKTYSLAEHCYYTGLLYMLIAKEDNVDIKITDIDKVFHHDILEVETGDLLYPAKHATKSCESWWDNIENTIINLRVPFLARYMDDQGWSSETALRLFKACDMLELYLFCLDEHRIGNSDPTLLRVIENIEHWRSVWTDFPTAYAIAEQYKDGN